MGIARLLLFLLLLAPAVGQGKGTGAFKSKTADAEVDWSAGTVTVQAGAAGDIRMPGPDSARPGAERRARVAAEDKLRLAVGRLAAGQPVDENAALKQAKVSRTEYQSDGGVVLWLTLRFADLVTTKGSPVALRVSSMPLEFAPLIKLSGSESRLGYATYRPAADCPRDAIRVERDRGGHLAIPVAAGGIDSFAGAAAVIYLEKAP